MRKVVLASLTLACFILAACSTKSSSSAPAPSSVAQNNSSVVSSQPVVSEPAPASSETAGITSEDIVVKNGSRDVPATTVLPEGEGPFPLIVINHGFAGSRNEGGGFTRLAEIMAKKGLASIRMDFAGCGDSKAEFLEFNNTNNLSDSEACLNWALENMPVDKENVGVLGYSNGGRLAIIRTAQENSPYKAMGLLAPAAFPATPERLAEDEKNLEEAKKNGFVSMEWFGNELHIGAKMYEDQIADYKYIDDAKNVCPTMVVYGGADTIVLPEISKAIAEKIGAATVEIPDADHGYGFYGGDETITELVANSFADFFATNLK